MSEPKSKSFEISKRVVFEAYRRVKANKGTALSDALGHTEIQTTAAAPPSGLGKAGHRGPLPPRAVRSLAIRRTPLTG